MNTQKLKANWLKAMAAAFAAALMATGTHGAEKITVDEVANHYPWDGKVDCVTTLSGLDTTGDYEYKGAFTLSVRKDGAKVSKAVTNAFASADGTYTNTFDCTALFGAGLYPNGGIVVDLVKEKSLGGVQLWADGPYWAECNVGATKPEEYGYYFWWGDTVGYTNKKAGFSAAWISVKDGTKIQFSSSSSPANSTHNENISKLISNGYIDSTTSNLVAKYDAATANLDGPWRMPTYAEMQALQANCTTEWITTNGVCGRLVTGKDEYASKSIFFPAAGYGSGSGLDDAGSSGTYWSSTPSSSDAVYAFYIEFKSSGFYRYGYYRYYGRSVRPVRTASK